MKHIHIIYLTLLSLSSAHAEGLQSYTQKKSIETAPINSTQRAENSQTLSRTQDELSADVQELIEAQTNENVITLFENVEELMASVTDNLHVSDTGTDTIFSENQIIEKIFEAAKEKAKSSDGEMDSMLEELEEAMGEGDSEGGKQKGQGKGEGQGEGEGEGSKPGEGGSGTTDAASETFEGNNTAKGKRILEKKSGLQSDTLPSEYQNIIDAYNNASQRK